MRLKIGKKVAVMRFNVKKNQEELEVGRIVGIRDVVPVFSDHSVKNVAVMFNGGRIKTYYESELFKKWAKGLEKW